MKNAVLAEADRYLILPVNPGAPLQDLVISAPGREDYRLSVRLSPQEPFYHTWVDVCRFAGCALTVTPDIPLVFSPEFQPDGVYHESLRPQVHFSTKRGWSNDPNGLIKIGGVWHMFYQHNPAEACWGNMHWGHAVSRDLLHWQELGAALFPGRDGACWSGSAIEDTGNVSGLGRDGKPPVILYYTSATEDPALYTQHAAFSVDGGLTFTAYPAPVVDNIAAGNRDPKVVFCAEKNCFVMALYLDGEDKDYALLSSRDLLTWQEFQRIKLFGDGECPDLYPLDDEDGQRFWVFSGASDRYLIGSFSRSGLFEPEGEARQLFFGDNMSYAAQTFSGTGSRRLRISWNRTEIRGMPFNMQMTFPVEMKLHRRGRRHYLTASPIGELSSLYTDGGPAAWYISASGMARPGAALSVLGHELSLPFTGPLELEIIADRMGAELFVNGGESICTAGFKADMKASPVRFTSFDTEKCETHPLASIWPEE